MSIAEDLTTSIANTMSAAGHDISDRLYNALKTEFTLAIEEDQEEDNSPNLDTFLVALEYAITRTCIARSNR